ncbi:unnamed protein product [Effrenium voratum]|nr:unnamed protein product [Effrenium voratum]
MEPSRSNSESSNPQASAKESWRAWSGRDAGSEAYKFGDFSRGLFSQMKAGVLDLKQKANDTALSLKEEHEQRAVEYVRGLAAEDEEVAEISQNALEVKETTSAERFWADLRKDAHTDHDQTNEDLDSEEFCGALRVEVVQLGSEGRPLAKADKKALKPILLLSLHNKRSGGLKESQSCAFQVRHVVGADLGVYTYDRAGSKFDIGMEDASFCGGCAVPLTAILERDAQSTLKSSFSQTRFEARVVLNLLPLALVRSGRKLEPGEVTGAKRPQEELGTVTLKLSLELKQSPAQLYFQPFRGELPATVIRGHVSDPFSVIRAAGLAIARISFALKMDQWKAAMDEMREGMLSPVLILWWTYLVLVTPVWTWPLLFNLFLGLFAWALQRVAQQRTCEERRRLYADEGAANKESTRGTQV